LLRLPNTHAALDVARAGAADRRNVGWPAVQNAIDTGRRLPRSQTLVIERASHALFPEAEGSGVMVTFFEGE
jgi:hypothetical protein